jgi:hypothetical protein
METQLRKPARSKASYTDQYKQERWNCGVTADAVQPRWRPDWKKNGVNPHHLKKLKRGNAEILKLGNIFKI